MSTPSSRKLASYASIAFFLSCLASSVTSQNYDYPNANLSTLWTNAFNGNNFRNISLEYVEASTVRPILLRILPGQDEPSSSILAYSCGFYCHGVACDAYLFSIYILHIIEEGGNAYVKGTPQVVWSANRDNPVGENATVEFTKGGDLLLRDANGSLVWSTDTEGNEISGLTLTEMGNLLMYGANLFIWQSFDHPADCLLPGQILGPGKSLTAGLYSVSMSDIGLVGSVLSHPQIYSNIPFYKAGIIAKKSYAVFREGSLDLYANLVNSSYPDRTIRIPSGRGQYMKLEDNGHLRIYGWSDSWKELDDIFTGKLGQCAYPTVCGEYGICTNRNCSCPGGSSFRPIDGMHSDLGCSEVVPLTCDDPHKHSFLDLHDVTYSAFDVTLNFTDSVISMDMDSCKDACLKNCSCKAAMFFYGSNSSEGYCYLPTKVFSLMSNQKEITQYNSTVSLKIQIKEKASLLWPILGSVLGILVLLVLVGTAVFAFRRRKRRAEDVETLEDDCLDHFPGMPTRFTLKELSNATENFNKKLGEGGFGSVYEGSLNDGTRIAVKRLEGVGHIKRSFLAEVGSIGSIHHINLVRLIGFCAEKSHRLLVYEYMCNGSLEKWIYNGSHETDTSLGWNTRRKIILDVAKGLAYLHEDCRQKIIHLDIKPQNILLDKDYNAKLADFGLSKLIDRNQSEVVTTMRGTPGYLAPEWLSAVITEKVDVYSFGVVVLEIITGRKIFEQFRPEGERHLLTFFKKIAEEGRWLDLVHKCYLDEEFDVVEVKKMMQISAWCLQSDHEKRPSMSMVIKVMEGAMDVPEGIDYDLLIPRYLSSKIYETSSSKDVTPLLPVHLSGPR